jgi:ketosteroid isomerase-like protein
MGVLSFSEVEVTALSPDAAFAFGRWRLERAQDAPSGLFTLLCRRAPGGWRIVHDHTSAAESPPKSGKAGGRN